MVIIIYIVFKGDRHLKVCLNKAYFDLRNLETKCCGTSLAKYME